VNIALRQQFPANRLARSAFEQPVVRHHDRTPVMHLQQVRDVLQEIQPEQQERDLLCIHHL